jgi:arginase family enzyme
MGAHRVRDMLGQASDEVRLLTRTWRERQPRLVEITPVAWIAIDVDAIPPRCATRVSDRERHGQHLHMHQLDGFRHKR